jgi:threonylcarbamoyladenosine tRNA methylthiotransferase MtaB
LKKQQKIKTVSFHTLGCKLNQAETNSIRSKFIDNGFTIVPFKATADLTIINTCTVTNSADSKSRQAIRTAIKSSPNGRVVAMGCYSQIKPKELGEINGIDMILGNQEKYKIFSLINQLETDTLEAPLIYVSNYDEIEVYEDLPFILSTGRTRAFLKIQEGCDYFCSYCIIPFARGKARSRKLQSTIDEAKRLVDNGYQELVLTGINIGTWNDNGFSLIDLLEHLSDIEGVKRIRISSIEPNTVTDDLLHLISGRENICNHLHIPLQSGSQTVLERMGRKYIISDYIDLVSRVNSIIPNVGLGTDIIVGFPGESKKEFMETNQFIEENPFSYLHVFRYSERTGTKASQMLNKVSAKEMKKRSVFLHKMGEKKQSFFNDRFINHTVPVLFETRKGGRITGLTENNIRVIVKSSDIKQNTIRFVKLVENIGNEVLGRLI